MKKNKPHPPTAALWAGGDFTDNISICEICSKKYPFVALK